MLGESSDLKAGPPHPPFTHGFLDAIWSSPPSGPPRQATARGTPERGPVFPLRPLGRAVSPPSDRAVGLQA